MIDNKQIKILSTNEIKLLEYLRDNVPNGFDINESIKNENLFITLSISKAKFEIDICFDNQNDLIVLNYGNWTHEHPETFSELSDILNKVIEEKIVIWKVTRPNGYEYFGAYDLDDYNENPMYIDEPDSNIEVGDYIIKKTIFQIIEEKKIQNA